LGIVGVLAAQVDKVATDPSYTDDNKEDDNDIRYCFLCSLVHIFLLYRYVNSGIAKGNATGRIDNNEIKNRDLNQLMEWMYATPQKNFGGRTE
jgi:hypothetical protein